MHHRPLAAAAALTLAVIGCVPTTPGELGEGSFTYRCEDGLYDASCANAFDDDATMPNKVAVNAPFEVRFYSDEGGAGSAVVFSASGLILDESAGTFRFLKPGFSAILARDSSGAVIDFLHVQARDVDALQLQASGEPLGDTVELVVGDSLLLAVEPTDSEGDILSGGIELTWSSSTESVELAPWDESLNKQSLVAVAEGTSQVTVSGAGRARVLEVIVGGTP